MHWIEDFVVLLYMTVVSQGVSSKEALHTCIDLATKQELQFLTHYL